MSDPSPFAKCGCRACGNRLEFPVEASGAVIQCPHCQQETDLYLDETSSLPPEAPSALTLADLQSAFKGSVARTPVSIFYRLGLIVVTFAMIVLPLIYLAMIAAAGWAVYAWATRFTFLLNSGGGSRLWILKALAYGTPLFAGAVLVFFMVKPLFARRAPHAQPLALNPGAEPLLFAFVSRICQAVGAPCPARIDIDCQLNASASFRRGLVSFFGNDLVLTIGMPLVAGLNLRQFAGVLAHEFGHFTQGFGMRLTYIIRSINGWFARVVFERDAWDLRLEEAAEVEDWRVSLVVGVARLAVWFSRQLLHLLMLIGHGISCFMLRQMEYDADSYETKLAGSEAFETTTQRIHVLGDVLNETYKTIRTSWNLNRRLPDNFPLQLLRHDGQFPAGRRTQIQDTLGLARTGLFSTHPSPGDRIRCARKADEPGVFDLEVPATLLFSNFEVPAKQVTALHYADDLGIPVEIASLVPDEKPAEEPAPLAEEQVIEASVAKTPSRLKIKLPSPPAGQN